MDKDGFLHLTEEGREIAEKIYERHQFFTEQFIAMGVSETTQNGMPAGLNTLSVMRVFKNCKDIL